MIQLCPYCKEQWCEANNSNEIKDLIIQKFVNENPAATLVTTVIARTFMPPAVTVPVAIGMNLLLGKKYQFHCSNCGGEWETDNEETDQTKEYKQSVATALTSLVSDNPMENYKAMSCLTKLFGDNSKQQNEGRFNELANNYINKFLEIPEQERRFLVVTDNLEYLPKAFVVLPMNKMPQGISFPTGHPRSHELYVLHLLKPNEYIPYNKYQLSLFRDEMEEFMRIMRCLGAKSISFKDEQSKEQQSEEDTDKVASMGIGYEKYGEVNTRYESGERQKEYKKIADKLMVDRTLDINPNIYPYMPQNAVWFPRHDIWTEYYESRMAGQERHFVFKISTDEIEAASKQERINIEAELNILSSKANGKYGTEKKTSLCSEISHTWTVDVEFYPLSAYNTPDSNKELPQITQSATLTAEEEEYLTELKEVLADGEISPRERRLLEKIRIQSGISEERAAELENSLTALKLTEEEQEYLDEYKDVIADGEITERERRLLEKFRTLNGISEERAREIEASVKR